MRHGIRDFLVVIAVLFGGLAISPTAVVADDPPAAASADKTSAEESPDEAAEQPAPEAEADPPAAAETDEAAADDAAAEQPPAAVEAPAGDDAAAADPPADEAPPAEEDAAPAAEDEPGAEAGEEPGAEAGEEPAAAAGEEPAHDVADESHEGKDRGDDHEVGEHHVDEHHDPYDLSHVNATASLEDPSEIKSDLAIWTFVVFLCLLALLAKFAWGPIMEGLERREAGIAAAIDEAEQAAAKGAETLRQYEAKLAAATEETREMLAKARKDAEAAGQRIITEAQETAARERQRAVADINAAKNTALSDITEHSVDLAVAMAGRMIQRQLTPDDRATLIREALDQLPNQN